MQFLYYFVLVIGGVCGLGEYLVCVFVCEGVQVIINYLYSVDVVEFLVGELGVNVLVVCVDVIDCVEVNVLIVVVCYYFGCEVSCVVNNVLVVFLFNGDVCVLVDSIDWQVFSVQFDGSVCGVFNMVQVILFGMCVQGFGWIINIGINLFQNLVVFYYDYIVVKVVLLLFICILVGDFGLYGIIVNMLFGGLLCIIDVSVVMFVVVFDYIVVNILLCSVIILVEFVDVVLFFVLLWVCVIIGQNLVVDGGLVCD